MVLVNVSGNDGGQGWENICKSRQYGSVRFLAPVVRIGDSMLMIGGGSLGRSWHGAGIPGAFHIYVPDCDAVCRSALAAGAKSIAKPKDQS